MLMAGLDGIQNSMGPGDPVNRNLYDLPPEELRNIPSTPALVKKS
jgi:glutamine synthetase